MRNLFIFLAAASAAFCGDSRLDEMLRDVDFIENVFHAKYGPKEWKADRYDWRIDEAAEALRQEFVSLEAPSTKQFQQKLARFFQSFRDYHVRICFYSTEQAYLPFQVLCAQDRYYFVWIDRDQLPKETFPFDVGDELVRFDDRPVSEVVEERYQAGRINANEGTDRALAALALTARTGITADTVPHGPVNIEIRRKGADKLSRYQVIWTYRPEKIRTRGPHLAASNFFDQDMSYHSPLLDLCDKQGDSPYNRGHREGFLPDLGKSVWESASDCPFRAYMFQLADKRLIGYVRIPAYRGDAEQVSAFGEIIERFEEFADLLIVDQLCNPGGNWFYYSSLASMLTDQALWAPLRQWTLTQKEISEALETIAALEKVRDTQEAQAAMGRLLELDGPAKEYCGYPITYEMTQFFLEHCRFLLDQWDQGKRLTDPAPLWGMHKINPSPTARFTKPILMLINEFDFSAADFIPAILQDNKRATLMGARTSGAGGNVEWFTYPNAQGVDMFSVTASLAWRINGQPIENLGVTPDVPYTVTAQDLECDYKDYKAAILEQVNRMLTPAE